MSRALTRQTPVSIHSRSNMENHDDLPVLSERRKTHGCLSSEYYNKVSLSLIGRSIGLGARCTVVLMRGRPP